MLNQIFVLLLIVLVVLTGCDSGGGSDNNSQFFNSTPVAVANLTVPTGSDATSVPGVAYSFDVTISGVNGVGTFAGSLDSVTGTASFAGLSIVFSNLTEIDTRTYRATGTVSGPFTGEGTVAMTVTYTEPGVNIVGNSASFFVTVPPTMATITFSPSSPLNIAAGGADVTIQAVGSPSGGSYSFGGINPGTTGGTFTLVNPVDGTFTFTGTTDSGTATIDIIYNPPSNVASPVTETYTVNVSNIISTDPASPLGVRIGDPVVTITATGDPAGGTFALGAVNTGLTGGSFSLVDSDDGIFSFGGAISSGTATAEFLYTPPGGALVSFVYTVNVSSFSFSPASPTGYIVGAEDLEITAVVSPPGGTISFGDINVGSTGGVFQIQNSSAGIFTFGSATNIGIATAVLVYTPPGGGGSISETYVIEVSSISFPLAASSGIAASGAPGNASVALGDPPLTVDVVGAPAGGTFSFGGIDTSETGGIFTLLSGGPTAGSFTFGGAITPGTAQVELIYTPPSGVSGTFRYRVCVFGFSFIPSFPGTSFFGIPVGEPPLTITALGNPPGGTFTLVGFDPGTTGGAFSPIGTLDPSTNTFVFSGSTGAGTAIANILFTPENGSPSVETSYTVETVALLFSPASPLEITAGDVVTIDAAGIRGGGFFTTSNFVDNGTSGSFSAIDPITGVFTFSDSLSSGSASIDVTYTTAAGSSVTETYTVIVSSLAFSPSSPLNVFATVAGSPAVTITVVGGDDGGTIAIASEDNGVTGGDFAVTGAFTFTFSGATAGGTAMADITYTPPIGAPVTMTYVVNVTSLTFSPTTPLDLTVGTDATVTATGLPVGGTLSIASSASGTTGGTFTVTGPDTFTFTGSVSGGTATADLRYDPLVGATITLPYTINVTSLTFSPPTPLEIPVGADTVTVTALGIPGGGTIALGSVSSGGTGGSFTLLSSSTFSFGGTTASGTATADVTYTPPFGTPITLTYTVVVSDLMFSPPSPLDFLAGSAPVTITAIGSPPGGTIALGGTSGITGGSFTLIDPVAGTFSFGGASIGGEASVKVTYTPAAGAPVMATYVVNVTSLTFSPASPLGVTAVAGGSPAVTVTAIGGPAGGSISIPTFSSGGTGGTFIVTGPTTFTFSGATSGGVATADITYTPLVGAPITLTYTINVTSLSFAPASPVGTTVGTTVTVTASGIPPGGSISIASSDPGTTGGTFAVTSATTFEFSGSTGGGMATVSITYTPPVGPSITLPFDIFVTSITFSPAPPLGVLAKPSGSDPVVVTVFGVPSGGVISFDSVSVGGTGGTFSLTTSTSFTFAGATAGGLATADILYTPPAPAAPIIGTYTINVTALFFSPPTPTSIAVGSTLTVTVIGDPPGGSFVISGSSAGGTGGTFMATGPTTFTFDGSVTAGTATADITYTPPVGPPVTATYTVFVSGLAFSPPPPLDFIAGSPDVTITAIGSPSGGTITVGPTVGSTGGTFTLTGPLTFTFGGATTGGPASSDITYFPPSGAPVTATYVVNVTSMSFTPPPPLGLTVGTSSGPITAVGLPVGGIYSGGGVTDPITGGTFSVIDPGTGVFTFTGSVDGGSASTDISYTPPVGPTITLTYTVFVTNLIFSPTSPLDFLAGDPTEIITATGSPSGGTYTSTGTADPDGTGGTFSAIDPVSGVFTFGGATSGGAVTTDVTYTPGLPAVPITLTYTVNVTSLTFVPASPTGITVGSALSVTATGLPTGGVYTGGGVTDPTTGGTFSVIDSGAGTFMFTGSVTAGIASAPITYTPPAGPSITLTYEVYVSTLTFTPPSPLDFLAGDPTVTITAVGAPSGGTYSTSGTADPDGTGGTFGVIGTTSGVFTFGGATSGGAVTTDVTYTPPAPAVPITLTYTVNVTSLTFVPPSPIGVIVGDTLMVTATGLPAGGTYTGGGISDALTGGTFSTIDSGAGTFMFSGAVDTGTTSADFTYTPLVGPSITLTYTVVVSDLEFSPPSPLSLASTDSAVPVTAIGEPAGGSYASTFMAGTTVGLAVTAIDPVSGAFSVDPSGVTTGGTATVDVTYTPLAPAVSITMTYTINVTHLEFAPAPVLGVTSGSSTTVTMTGTPTGGVFSGGGVTDAVTGGTFSTPMGTDFTFSGATTAGTASTDYTYAPGFPFVPITLTYTVVVSDLEFSPASPLNLASTDSAVPVTAVGGPIGGTYSSTFMAGTTVGLSVSAIDPTSGAFSVDPSGVTTGGTATVDVTYTPVAPGVPVTATYTINVTHLEFAPAPTIGVTSGSSTMITMTGTPTGGVFSGGGVTDAVTGGTFSTPTGPDFTFSGATTAGTASADYTYAPGFPFVPITLTYTVVVSDLEFSPVSPLNLTSSDSAVPVTAVGGPIGGTYSSTFMAGTTAGLSVTAIDPTSGAFTVDPSGVTTGGTATVDVTYTPVAPGVPVTATYTINVTHFTFSPVPPTGVTVGSLLTVTVAGTPGGGTFTGGGVTDPTTGGTFSAVVGGTSFTFSGSTAAGFASTDYTYSPGFPFVPLTLTYTVAVTTLEFSPTSPLAVLPGDTVTVTAIGEPSGGTYSGVITSGLGTGLAIDVSTLPTTETFSVDATGAGLLGGTETVDVTYTPVAPAVPITVTYTINLTTLTFAPDPGMFALGVDTTIMTTATGTAGGAGGVYTGGGITDPITGGTFSVIDAGAGTFTFSGATTAGVATVPITFDPTDAGFATITLTYSVFVASLTFSPDTPLALLSGETATVTAVGAPSSGSYSAAAFADGGTGLTFSGIGAATGAFSFDATGATGGTATVDITYTPPAPSPSLTLTYTVLVTSMTFAPDPGTFAIGIDSTITITATGVAGGAGGTYSGGPSTDPLTGGTFTAIDPGAGTFDFSGPTTAGVASVDITFDPTDADFRSITLTYSVTVSSLAFAPTSPLGMVPGTSVTVTAVGEPAGGAYSVSTAFAAGATTGLTFATDVAFASNGEFTFTAAGTATGGEASVEITYAPPGVAAPVTATYLVHLTSLVFTPDPGTFVIGGGVATSVDADGIGVAAGTLDSGTYSGGGVTDPITGGTFSAIAADGTFTFDGAVTPGSASIPVTFTPTDSSFPTLTLTYTVEVSGLGFAPASPLGMLPGDTVTVAAIGAPAGGAYTVSTPFAAGPTTGLTFTPDAAFGTNGLFVFAAATTATGGEASVGITYTPPGAAAPVTGTYLVHLTSLVFTPDPGVHTIGGGPTALDADGVGAVGGAADVGTYSGGGTTDAVTGGTFTPIAADGTMTFDGAVFGGTATTLVTFTPTDTTFPTISLTYSVVVTSLSFAPPSPLSLLPGGAVVTVTAIGLPALGGTYSSATPAGPLPTTMVAFSGIDPVTGIFTVDPSGPLVTGGSDTISVTFTPAGAGAPITATYTIIVTSLTFIPASPAGFVAGSAIPLPISAMGLPPGGTYMNGGGSFDPLTKGFFTPIDPTTGAFSFLGAVDPGSASITVTYIPPTGLPISATYTVVVVDMDFSPASPLAVLVGGADVTVTAFAFPPGGLFSDGAYAAGGTGLADPVVGVGGTFVVMPSTATLGGTATQDVTYDPDGPGPLPAVTATYTINVTGMTFAPASPASITVGGTLPVTASGTPAGGTYSGGGFIDPDTGGLFSSIDPTAGTFTFSGSTTGGMATVDITYTPAGLGFLPITLTYTVEVSTLTFIPASPLGIEAPTVPGTMTSVTVTTLGDPTGGTYGTTGSVLADASHTFSGVDPSTGEFTFTVTAPAVAGTSTIDVTYTPPFGPMVSATYTVNVTTLTFAPPSPATVLIGGSVSVVATGGSTPAGGTFTFSSPDLGGTGGTFIVPPSPATGTTATFAFDGASATTPGVATIDVTYDPFTPGFVPTTLTYSVVVVSIAFSPTTPHTFTFGSPDVTVTATGTPGGGTFAFTFPGAPATGGTFMTVSTGPTTGSFTFGSPTTIATDTVMVTYTPAVGSPVTVPYVIDVVPGLTFSPATPLEIVVGAAPITIAAFGAPAGGVYSFTGFASSAPATGGTITTIDPTTGLFMFSGATTSGFESVDVMYDPDGAGPIAGITVTYTIVVTNLVFSPASGGTFDTYAASAAIATPLPIMATGGPAGGTFSIDLAATSDPNGTGGTFSAIDPATGIFSFGGATTKGTGATPALVSVPVTYTPAVGMGAPTTITYTVEVVTPHVSTISPALRVPTLVAPSTNAGPVTPSPTITVTGGPTAIGDVNVFVKLPHQRTDQTNMSLTSPGGTTIILTTIDALSVDGGPIPDSFRPVLFDDSAPTSVTVLAAAAPPEGVMPFEPLSTFIGEDANGVWTLTLEDDDAADAIGLLESWGLIFDGEPFVAPATSTMTFTDSPMVPLPNPPGAGSGDADVDLGTPGTQFPSQTVSGFVNPFLIDTNLTVDIPHGDTDQIDLFLTFPSGTTREISTDNGGSFADVYSPITFDDSGLIQSFMNFTPGAVVKVDGIPVNFLQNSVGETPNGLWELVVSDDDVTGGVTPTGTGTVVSWELELTTLGSTFTSGTVSKAILGDPVGALPPVPTFDSIEVPALGFPTGPITDIEVFVDIDHAEIDDFTITLVHEDSGTSVLLYSGVATGSDMGIVFSDSSAVAIGGFTGGKTFTRFMPSSPLAAFVGMDPAGEWNLIIVDMDGNAIDGVLNSWGMAFNGDTATIPTSSPFSLLASSQGFIPTPIPDLGTIAIPIVVPTPPPPAISTVADVRVFIDLTHTFDADLDITLTNPGGAFTIDLTSGNGGSGDDYASTIFDDDAATSITAGAAPFTGSFMPEVPLATFNGVGLDGTWTLTITDTAGGDIGTLFDWGLAFNGDTSIF